MIFWFVPLFSAYVRCLGFFALYSTRPGIHHHSATTIVPLLTVPIINTLWQLNSSLLEGER